MKGTTPLLVCLISAQWASAQTYVDGAFDSWWSVEFAAQGSSASMEWFETDGSPDEHIECTTVSGQVTFAMFMGAEQWTFAEHGAVNTIELSVDVLGVEGFGAGNAINFGLHQDGAVFRGPWGTVTGYDEGDWRSVQLGPCRISEFARILGPFDSDPSQKPVMSETAEPISLGFVIANTDSATIIQKYDNWTVTLTNRCWPDINEDGRLDTLDVLGFLNLWASDDPAADFNCDGTVNTLDVLRFLSDWVGGC